MNTVQAWNRAYLQLVTLCFLMSTSVEDYLLFDDRADARKINFH